MPLCVRFENRHATSDFNPWWYASIIYHFRAGTRSM